MFCRLTQAALAAFAGFLSCSLSFTKLCAKSAPRNGELLAIRAGKLPACSRSEPGEWWARRPLGLPRIRESQLFSVFG